MVKKLFNIRGGFRLAPRTPVIQTPSRLSPQFTQLPKMVEGYQTAKQIYEGGKTAYAGAKKVYGNVKQVTNDLRNKFKTGVDAVHGLFKNKKRMPLKGMEINGTPGKISETDYKSSIKARVPKLVKSAQKAEFVTDANFILTSTKSQQAIGDYTTSGSTFIYNDAVWGGNTSTKVGVFQTLNSFFQATQSTSKIYYDVCNSETLLTNFHSSPIIVDIYEVVAKHDLQDTSSISGNQILSPALFWTQGMSDSTVAITPPGAATSTASPSGKLTANDLGSFPWDSQLFNDYWKVCAQFRLNMGVGDTHRHKSEYKLGKNISYERYTNSAILGGITRNLLIVVSGVPGYDSTVNAPVVAVGRVGVSAHFNYKAYAIPYSGTYTYYAETNGFGTGDTVNSVQTDSPTGNSDSNLLGT